METSNLGQNQNVPIITPQPAAPKRLRTARWLTLAVLLFLVGGGSVYWLIRDNNRLVEAAPSATVEISSNGFEPQTIKVKRGQTVMWLNSDSRPHQIASDPYPTNETLPSLNSEEPLAEGESYTATLDETGTFTYHDELNPVGPKATIIVE